MIMASFDEGIELAMAEIDDMYLSEGIQSSIWVSKGLIIQRELTVTAQDEFDNTGTLSIKGTHQFAKNDQLLEYELSFEDDYDSGEVTIIADLSNNGEQINDKVTIGFDDMQVVY